MIRVNLRVSWAPSMTSAVTLLTTPEPSYPCHRRNRRLRWEKFVFIRVHSWFQS